VDPRLSDSTREQESAHPAQPVCLDPETVARYVDRTLEPSAIRDVEAHLVGCDDCRELVVGTAEATADLADEDRQRRPTRESRGWMGWAAAAAAVVVASIGLVRLADRSPTPDIASLVEAVGPQRRTAGRLVGGFQYGPLTGQTRSGSGTAGIDTRIVIATARIEEALAGRSDGASLIALGASKLLLGRIDEAIAILERARDADPSAVPVWIDLSAAYLEKAQRVPEAEAEAYLLKSFAAARRATSLAPNASEAWFNLAASQEKTSQEEAVTAWRKFVAIEPDPKWADEGRRRLAALGR
jgi:tetratricopeptide (TPR) repeat protein